MRQVRANKFYSVTGKCLRESDKAILVTISTLQGNKINSSSAMWFPKSQCEDLEIENDDTVEFMASEWILGEKGFAKELEFVDAPAEEEMDARDVEFGSMKDLPDSEIPF